MLRESEYGDDLIGLARDVSLNGISGCFATLRGKIARIGDGYFNKFKSTEITNKLENLKKILDAEITKLNGKLDTVAKDREPDQAKLQKIDNELQNLERIVKATAKVFYDVENELSDGSRPNFVNIRQHINIYANECANLSTCRKVAIGIIAFASALLFGALAFAAGVAITGGLDGGLTGALLATKAVAFGLSIKGAAITASATGAGAVAGGLGARFGIFRKTDLQTAAADLVNASNQFVTQHEKTGYLSLDSSL